MSALARSIQWFKRFDAPVLVQEMRVRQRGIKPFVVLFAYLLVLSAAAMLVLIYMAPQVIAHSGTSSDMSELGRAMFAILSVVQLAMVVLIVPAYSAGAVSGERERRTFDLLALTTLSSAGIVTQKLAAAVAQALMLIVGSVPIVSIVFLLGGVSPVEIAVIYTLLVVTAVLMGALGMLCSCCLRNSKSSTFLTYLIMFCFIAGLPIGGQWFLSVSRMGVFEYESTFPLMFALMFAFVGGVGALLFYAPLALMLSRTSNLWRTRAFRMGVFGGVYAALLLIMSVPAWTNAIINLVYLQNIFLPLFVNPFVAMGIFIQSRFGGGYGPSISIAYWTVGATIAFSLGCAFVFRQVSSARFDGLRRS